MGVMYDGLRDLKVRTRSPKGAFAIDFDVAGGIRVERGPAGFAGHTDDTLAAELTEGLRRTRAGTRKALAVLRDKAKVRRPKAGEPETRWQRRRRQFAEAEARVETSEISPRGIITIHIRGTGEFTAQIQRGALRRFHDDQLLTEVNTVLAAARRRHALALADSRHMLRKEGDRP